MSAFDVRRMLPTWRLSILCVLLAFSANAQKEFSNEGGLACLKCHESETIMGILETPHANFDDPRSPASRQQCESCHGGSALHMRFPMQVGNIRFSKHDRSTPVAQRNTACLECHGTPKEQEAWQHSPHGFEGVACVSCHVVHMVRDPMLSEEQQTLRCTEACHATILNTAPASSAHPLTGDGRILCTACHNPHGPLDLSACSACHAQDAPTLARQTPKARGYHERAIAQEIPCTSCHKEFVHAMPKVVLPGVSAR